MQDSVEKNPPANAKALLIEPGTWSVLWMNEAAYRDCPKDLRDPDASSANVSKEDRCSASPLPVEKAVPMAEVLGLTEALKAAYETGVSQYIKKSVISVGAGSMDLVASVYRLPDKKLLLILENAWHAKNRAGDSLGKHQTGRRTY
jgi:hypothetical protein